MSETQNRLDKLSGKLIEWVGSTTSLIAHSIFFVAALSLIYFGFDVDKILLILTTFLSIEAVYLSILVQMGVNKSHKILKEVSQDVGELHEEVVDD